MEAARLETGATAFPFSGTFGNNPGNLALTIGALVGLLIVGVGGIRQWRHARRMARLAPAAHVYEDMVRRARWLGVREEQHATPLERARAIGDAVPEARRAAQRVAALYAREKFGAREMDAIDRAALSNTWSTFGAAWRRALIAQTIDRIVTPPRQFIERTRIRLAHWNIPNK